MPEPKLSPLYAPRYGLVDALRGCAALAVVLAHVPPNLSEATFGGAPAEGGLHPFGYEAVLIFFVISGYCIAASARNCLERGFAFRDFMWRRVKRIYPPYLCAIAFWAATRYLKYRMGGDWTLDRSPMEWAQNITLTQWVSLLWDPINFPAMNPRLFVLAFWSLCYEEQFYLVMALLLALSGRFPRAVLHGSIALGVVSIAWGAVFPTSKCGLFIEYWAAFATGLLAYYRLCVLTDAFARRAIDIGLAVVAVGSAVVAWGAGFDWGTPPANGDPLVVSWSSLSMATMMALLLIVLRPLDARYLSLRFLSVPLAGLAAISYSLYLTHQYCIRFASTIATRALSMLHLPTDGSLRVILHIVVLLGVATVFWLLCERPFLNTKRPPARPRPAVGAGEQAAPLATVRAGSSAR